VTVEVTRYDPTPNPDALKCALSAPISANPRSFLRPDDARDDPLASAIFAAGGVRAVLVNGDWMTVNKQPGTDWKTLKPAVEQAVRDHARPIDAS